MIREARVDDLDEVIALVRELAEYERSGHEVELERESFGRYLFGPQPSARVLLAQIDGTIAGFALHPILIGVVLAVAGNAVLVRRNFKKADWLNEPLLEET